jgi:putative ABC transport system permease protein
MSRRNAPSLDRAALFLEGVWRDLRHGTRVLRHTLGFTFTAVLSLGIGIGANTAIFTVVEALLFRAPAGVLEPERLVDIGSTAGAGLNPGSYRDYLAVRERNTTLEDVFTHPMFPQAMSLGAPNAAGNAERVYGTPVTTNYFRVLGVRPAAGRLLDESDSDRPGASANVVLSYGLWSARFNRSPAVVGSKLTLNGRPFTVVGVASEQFRGTDVRTTELWIPLGMVASAETLLGDSAAAWLAIGGRLGRGVPLSAARAEIAVIGAALAADKPSASQNPPRVLAVLPAASLPGNNGAINAFLALLLGLTGCVLAIACANVTSVLLARGQSRQREIAVRAALGAGRAHLIRQLLIETLLLFGLGAVVGLLIAKSLASALVWLLSSLPFPIQLATSLDTRAVLFTAGLALLATLLSGLSPALEATRVDVNRALKDDARTPQRGRVRNAFVIAQVALSIVLVIVAGLFGRALERAGSFSPGFDPTGVDLVQLDLGTAGYDESTGPVLLRALLERVRTVPDVRSATVAVSIPGGFESLRLGDLVKPSSSGAISADALVTGDWNAVEPGYFATMRMPLVAGRDFTSADRKGAPPAIIVGEGAAKKLWPDKTPAQAVGQTVGQSMFDAARGQFDIREVEVVGVAHDPRYGTLIDGNTGVYVYVPLEQQYWSRLMLVIRTSAGRPVTDEVRGIVASLDPRLSIESVQSAAAYSSVGLMPQRLAVSVAGSLGMFGLLLAAIGVYGVTAQVVATRTREIGIRIALGAPQRRVLTMVLRRGMSLVAAGALLGVLVALGASQLLGTFLLDTGPLDPVAFVFAVVLFAAIGALACYGPALRATHLSPVDTLRAE